MSAAITAALATIIAANAASSAAAARTAHFRPILLEALLGKPSPSHEAIFVTFIAPAGDDPFAARMLVVDADGEKAIRSFTIGAIENDVRGASGRHYDLLVTDIDHDSLQVMLIPL